MKKGATALSLAVSTIAVFALFFIPNITHAGILYTQDQIDPGYFQFLVIAPNTVATSSTFEIQPNTQITSVRVVVSPAIATSTASIEVYMSCGTTQGSSPSSFAQRWVFKDFSSLDVNSFYGATVSTSSENRFGNANDDPRNTTNNQGYWWSPTVPVNCRIDYRPYYTLNQIGPFNSNINTSGINAISAYELRPVIAIYSDVVVGDLVPVYFTSFQSSGFATSTAATFCDNSFSTTTGFIDSVGASIANGLCRVAVFLIVPPQNAIDDFNDRRDELINNSFPFSWFTDVNDILSEYTASSSVNFPSLTIAFGSSTESLGLGNVEVISTSTLSTYMPESVRQSILVLLASGFYLLAISYIYTDLRNIWGKERT